MSLPPLNSKFVRALHVTPGAGVATGARTSMISIHKAIYEFWGFCVHGSDDLLNPGGYANSQVTGSYLSMPVGFESGSTILVATGSDGQTTQGFPYFAAGSSTPFAPTVEGLYLVTWVSGSTSTDDSIYRITQWLNSSSIVVDVTSGGTVPQPNVGGAIPTFTTRTGINYRVVDISGVGLLSPITAGQYQVLQFPDASTVNVGQAQSQFKLSGISGFDINTVMQIQLSPSGSWDGTQFVGESYGAISPETNQGPGHGGGSPDWFHDNGFDGGGDGYISLFGGTGYLICAIGGGGSPFPPFETNNAGGWSSSTPTNVSEGVFGGASYFHVEIPQRLYPQANDPNPICACQAGGVGLFVPAEVGYGYGHRFFPSPYDTLLRRWPVQVRCYTGAAFYGVIWNDSFTGGYNTRYQLFVNPALNKFVFTDGILSMGTVAGQASAAGQFSMARARLRTARFCGGSNFTAQALVQGIPAWLRVGDNSDQWIHMGQSGVLWPWDGAVLSEVLVRGA